MAALGNALLELVELSILSVVLWRTGLGWSPLVVVEGGLSMLADVLKDDLYFKGDGFGGGSLGCTGTLENLARDDASNCGCGGFGGGAIEGGRPVGNADSDPKFNFLVAN